MKGFPLGGKELWDVRCAGQRPDEMVVVSLIGPLVVPNPMLWVGESVPDATVPRLEWRMLAGLDVEVWASGSTPVPRVLAALRAVLPHAADVFVAYPGFRVAVRWLDPSLPVRVVEFDDELPDAATRATADMVARRLGAELRV